MQKSTHGLGATWLGLESWLLYELCDPGQVSAKTCFSNIIIVFINKPGPS